jgi:hypothetical protein
MVARCHEGQDPGAARPGPAREPPAGPGPARGGRRHHRGVWHPRAGRTRNRAGRGGAAAAPAAAVAVRPPPTPACPPVTTYDVLRRRAGRIDQGGCVPSRSLAVVPSPAPRKHYTGSKGRPGHSGRVAQMVRARRLQRSHARRSRRPVDQRRQALLQVEAAGRRVAGVDASRLESTCVTGSRKSPPRRNRASLPEALKVGNWLANPSEVRRPVRVGGG